MENSCFAFEFAICLQSKALVMNFSSFAGAPNSHASVKLMQLDTFTHTVILLLCTGI